jgi:hypothetical protein
VLGRADAQVMLNLSRYSGQRAVVAASLEHHRPMSSAPALEHVRAVECPALAGLRGPEPHLAIVTVGRRESDSQTRTSGSWVPEGLDNCAALGGSRGDGSSCGDGSEHQRQGKGTENNHAPSDEHWIVARHCRAWTPRCPRWLHRWTVTRCSLRLRSRYAADRNRLSRRVALSEMTG